VALATCCSKAGKSRAAFAPFLNPSISSGEFMLQPQIEALFDVPPAAYLAEHFVLFRCLQGGPQSR